MLRFLKFTAIFLLILGCETEDNPTPNPDADISEYRKIKEIHTISSLNGVPFENIVQKFEYRDEKPYQITYAIDSTYGRVYQFEYNSQNKIKTIYLITSEEISAETAQPIQAGMDISGADSLFSVTRYSYDNNNLVRISTEGTQHTLNYHVENDNGRIVSMELESIPFNNDIIFRNLGYKYNSNENIYEIQGTTEDEVVVNEYEYDENINPFHSYYENFGFVNVRTEGVRDGFASFISPNNIISDFTEIIYDNRGYPIESDYYDYTDYRKQIEFIYQ